MDAETCFACDPRPPAVTLRAPSPRALCPHHKVRCTLPDGLALLEALARARPAGAQLEGAALAYVYNPVFVVGTAGQAVKGWTEFAGGGMAVFEDRFGAASRFEYWALEQDALRDLWRPLLTTHGRDGASTDLRAVAETLDAREAQPGRQAPRAPNQGYGASMQFMLGLARSNWRLQRLVEERRARSASPWPASLDDLDAWLEQEPHSILLPPDWTSDADSARFTRDLVAAATRWVAAQSGSV